MDPDQPGLNPYCLQYRVLKCTSRCKNRHQFKLGSFFPRRRGILDIKNSLTDMVLLRFIFHTKYKESN